MDAGSDARLFGSVLSLFGGVCSGLCCRSRFLAVLETSSRGLPTHIHVIADGSHAEGSERGFIYGASAVGLRARWPSAEPALECTRTMAPS